MDEKPFNVRVAEALGLAVRDDRYQCPGQCVRVAREGGEFPSGVRGGAHEHGGWVYLKVYEYEDTGDRGGEWVDVERYETDWGATGPLLKRFGIGVFPLTSENDGVTMWVADREHVDDGCCASDPDPIVAVCKLIVMLREAGKLPKES